MESLYVLQLAGGKYYVGKTTDVKNRIEQHMAGKGSEWTRLHKPVKVLETRRLKDQYDETNTTKEYMKKYGIENVRGGAYVQMDLPETHKEALKSEIRAAADTCFTCGKSGHFASACPKKEAILWVCGECKTEWHAKSLAESCCAEKAMECSKCGRSGHTRSDCYARTHEDGSPLSKKKTAQSPPKGACYRCGRTGHYSPDCYAYTSVSGGYIGKPKRDPRDDWSDDDSDDSY